jgi:hypothetical protein
MNCTSCGYNRRFNSCKNHDASLRERRPKGESIIKCILQTIIIIILLYKSIIIPNPNLIENI